MKPLVVTVILAALAAVAHAQSPAPSVSAPQTIPVTGTFDRSSIVLAFYRSPLWEAILNDRRFELSAVKAANDTARAKELEKYGGESQDRAMQQLAGKAPIDNVLTVLRPEFKDLNARLKLAGIVESSAADPKAASVDVTPLLMDWLKASSETRKMAADLHAMNPASK